MSPVAASRSARSWAIDGPVTTSTICDLGISPFPRTRAQRDQTKKPLQHQG
jgi:hypothetical protein